MKIKDLFLIPNIVTLSRLFITILLFQQYTPSEFSPIILIIIIAIIGLSDSLDGIIARKLNQVSKLGTILDPITDRIVFILLIIWLNPVGIKSDIGNLVTLLLFTLYDTKLLLILNRIAGSHITPIKRSQFLFKPSFKPLYI